MESFRMSRNEVDRLREVQYKNPKRKKRSFTIKNIKLEVLNC